MALNTSKCNHLISLHFKGLIVRRSTVQTENQQSRSSRNCFVKNDLR